MTTAALRGKLKDYYARTEQVRPINQRLIDRGLGYRVRWPEFPHECLGMICGAKTRKGTPCKQKGIFKSGRCKLHGGMSTGPKTQAGKEQMRINGRKGGRPRKDGKITVRSDEK